MISRKAETLAVLISMQDEGALETATPFGAAIATGGGRGASPLPECTA